jgi:quercetin dioxygenase-like cupin family protein
MIPRGGRSIYHSILSDHHRQVANVGSASSFIGSCEMAIPHAKSGEVIDIRPLGATLAQARTTTLVKTKALEIIRLIIPSGKDIPVHQAHGEITVQCLEGRVAFTAGNRTQDLEAGQLLYLSSGEPHSLHGIEDASLLLTILLG